MLTRLSYRRRWLVYPSLLVWWLWSTMALCNAQSFAAAGAAQSLTAIEHSAELVMHGEHGSTAGHADHSAANMAHDCCDDDSALASCCGDGQAIKTKSTLDVDPHVVVILLSWLVVLVEPALSALPMVDTIDNYAAIPRLHLLLCVFLD